MSLAVTIPVTNDSHNTNIYRDDTLTMTIGGNYVKFTIDNDRTLTVKRSDMLLLSRLLKVDDND